MVRLKKKEIITLYISVILAISPLPYGVWQDNVAEAKDREGSLLGGTYRRPLESMPRTFDPALTTDIYSVTVNQQIFEGLVQFDQNLNVIPAIAKSWRISPDGLTYTFFLREGVKFHNGREVTANDFIYSFSRIMDRKNKSLAADLLGKVLGCKEFQEGATNHVKGFKAIGNYGLEIRLSEPFYPLISALGTVHFKVVPREEIEKPGFAFSKNPIGAGPFKFVSMKEKEEIFLEANQDYFEGRPYLDRIVFKIFHGSPRETILKEFKKGSLDESFIPPTEVEDIVQGGIYLFLQKPILSLRFFGLNSMSKPLDNKKLRQAINFAIDKKLIVSQIHKNQFHLAKGILPPGMPGYDPMKNPYPFDETLALKLLSESGYPKGQALPNLEIWSNTKSEAAQNELNEIQFNLKKVGISTTLHFETNWPNFESLLRANKAPMFMLAWYADFPDPDSLFSRLFHSKARNNFAAYSRPEVDRLIEKARSERDYLKRMEDYRKIETIVLEDAPIVPMIHHLFQMIYQPYVNGIEVSALGGHYIPMKKIWLKKAR